MLEKSGAQDIEWVRRAIKNRVLKIIIAILDFV